MELRMLGRSGLKVSPLCFGGNVFGWTIDEKRSFEVLNAFVGAGFNFIDTADVYSTWVPGHQGGESEAIIGNWMVEVLDGVVFSEAHQPLQQQQTSPAMLIPPSLDAAGRLAFPQRAQRFWRGRQPCLSLAP